MPVAIITYDPKIITEKQIVKLRDMLREVVAEKLSMPGRETSGSILTVDQITVKISPHGKLDVGCLPLDIIILANDYVDRRGNLNERATGIKDAIKNSKIFTEKFWAKEKKLGLWIRLAYGSSFIES